MTLQSIIDKGMANGYYAGAVASFWQGNKALEVAVCGMANVETNEEMTSSMRFDFASVTKLFTTTLVLYYITNKKLSLQQSIGKFIQHEAIQHVTIEQLLTHTSGIVSWHPFYENRMNGKTFIEILHNIDIQANAKINQVTYSDLNFMILKEICEQLGNQPFELQMANLLENLSIENCEFSYKRKLEGTVATEYGNRIEQRMCTERGLTFSNWRQTAYPIVGECNDGNAHYYFQGVAGHAGLFGDYHALIKLAQLYLKGGDSLLDKELVDYLMQLNVYGRTLGFSKETIFSNGIGHTGFTGTMLYIQPETEKIIVLLTNRLHVSQPKDLYEVRKEIIQYGQ